MQGHRREGDGLGGPVNTKDRDRLKERDRLKDRFVRFDTICSHQSYPLLFGSARGGFFYPHKKLIGVSLSYREKLKLDALRKEKDKTTRDKNSKSSEGKDAEAAKKRKLDKSSPTEGGSKGSLDYRVVALTVRTRRKAG